MRKSRRLAAEGRGQIELFHNELAELAKKFKRLAPTAESRWKYEGNKDNASFFSARSFKDDELEELSKILTKGPHRVTAAQVRAHLLARQDKTKPVGTLPILETAIIAYLKKGIVRGWVFRRSKKTADSHLDPWLVTDVKYLPPEQHRDYRIPARVQVSFSNWQKGKLHEKSHTFYHDALGVSVSAILERGGMVHETQELVDLYFENEKVFMDWRNQMGNQFIANGNFESKDEDGWSTADFTMHNSRLVVDDRCDGIERRQSTTLFSRDEDDEIEADGEDANDAARYTLVPLGLYIWCFNLESHASGFIHMESLKPYVYRPEIRTKLILPPENEDLIDVLTTDMDILMEDIVFGKSGGTAIVCQGPAGTGKTLTAEVYAEVIKRPLYRVHSGQLGIEAEGVERVLKDALDNAERWKCPILIDEADVFIMRRGADLALNAVCGVFLRLLEYYPGLIFLTTNREDAIDEAILSRTIARITFNLPSVEERKKLWQSLGEVYSLKLTKDPKNCALLAKTYECSGRDIKGLIRLVIKYCRRSKRVPTVPDINRLAKFRGL